MWVYLLTALFEEGFYRGTLLPLLHQRLSAARAVLLSAALFGLLHLPNILYGQAVGYTLIQVLGACCMGVGFGALWLRAGSIWPLVVLHAVSDFTQQITGLPPAGRIAAGTVQSIMLLAYGLYLLSLHSRENRSVVRVGSTSTLEVARG